MNEPIIFKAGKITQSIEAFLKFIEINPKRFCVKESFDSALNNLIHAKTDIAENQKHNLRKARDYFICATGIEKKENLISVYLGIAMCQFLLGDIQNSQYTISQIKGVKLSFLDTVKYIIIDKISEIFFTAHVVSIIPHRIDRIADFENYKKKALQAYFIS